MLKQLNHDFDPSKEKIRNRHLWVLLLGLPLEFWNKPTFMEIGNELSRFLHVEKENLEGEDKKSGKAFGSN